MFTTRLSRLWSFQLFLSLTTLISAQQCYYPNGDLSTTDAPCSSAEGAACCPLDWQCLDNGLCYLEAEQYFGRYTCTDKSWESDLCPGMCTNNNRDSGNQAVQQCSNKGGQYCCDQNRDASNVCCNRNDDSIFFNLPRGNPTATIKSLDGPAEAQGSGNSNAGNGGNGAGNSNGNSGNGGNGDGNGNNNGGNNGNGNSNNGNNNDNENEDSNSNPPANSQNPPNPATTISRPPNPATTIQDLTTSTPPPRTTTQTRSSTSSAPNGATSLILLTSTIASTPSPSTLPLPASAPQSSSSSSSSTNAATIGGATAGGVVALLLLALLAFLLRRRRKQKRAKEIQNATVAPRRDYLADADKEGGMEYMYRNSGHGGWTGDTLQGNQESPEIDGMEVGRGVRGGGVPRPGEKTRVGRKGGAGVGGVGGKEEVGGGQGLGLERQDVAELPAGDIPSRVEQPGQLDGTAVDKWRAYEIAANRGR